MDIENTEILISKIITELKSKYQVCEICGKDLTENFDATSTLTIQNYSFDIDEDICQECANNIENLVEKQSPLKSRNMSLQEKVKPSLQI